MNSILNPINMVFLLISVQAAFLILAFTKLPARFLNYLKNRFYTYIFKNQAMVTLNKVRGVRISWHSKYNCLTKRHDLPEWLFLSQKHIIAKVSRNEARCPNQIVFVKQIHSGCMGDHATVIKKNGTEAVIDECALLKPSLPETISFMLLPVYQTIKREFPNE